MYKLEIICSSNGPWFVGFKDAKGLRRLLPTKQRKAWLPWNKKWTQENCPPMHSDSQKGVVSFDNKQWIERVLPGDVLRVFLERYQTLELFLATVNNGYPVEPLTYEEVRWNTRNRNGRCGQCGQPYNKDSNPRVQEGRCQTCHQSPQ